MQVKRAAGLGSGAGFAFAAEGLHAHHGPDHVAVHIDIACMRMRGDEIDGFIDPAMDAERQSIASRIDTLDQGVQLVAPESYNVKTGPNTSRSSSAILPISISVGGTKVPAFAILRQRQLEDIVTCRAHAVDMREQPLPCLGIDHRADIGGQPGRIPKREFLHRVLQHLQNRRQYLPAGTVRASDEQRCPALSNADTSTSCTTCSGTR